MLKRITPVFILAMLSVIFAYDTIAAAFGSHATISEASTSFLYTHPAGFVLLFIGFGILIGHILFSVNYNE